MAYNRSRRECISPEEDKKPPAQDTGRISEETMAEQETNAQQLYRRAKQRIPGGTQLLSKRPEMFAPDVWPAYFREAKGCEVTDLDGNRYIDMSHNGVGACLLGYAYPVVTQAVCERLKKGSACTLNPPEEVELADRLRALHPWAEQARFARGGGEACAMAVRIARATAGRSIVAVCGYHGWHDWYLAANLGDDDALRGHLLPGLDPAGVPRELRGTALTFAYGDRLALQRIFDTRGDQIAAVIMEPCRHQIPEPGFLEFVRDTAHAHGALLIFDEITIGWRYVYGGAHLRLGVEPDMAVFAKALGNGHPIAAVIGTRDAMEGAQHSFISSTCWTEATGAVAALATLDMMAEVDVPEHVAAIGTAVQACWREKAALYSLPVSVPEAFPCLAHFSFGHPEGNLLRTLFTQYMLAEGFLAGAAFYPTLAHNMENVERYSLAADRVFSKIAADLERGVISERLEGPPAHTGFQRLL
jgi:glutamate-1-semialdehyde 2,1-aminomutase